MPRHDRPRLMVLDGARQPLTVSLDGRALRVGFPDGSAMLAPLARVDRILSRGDVTFSAEALAAVAGRGGQIALLRGDGVLLALMAAPGAAMGARGTPVAPLSPQSALLRQRSGQLEALRGWPEWPGAL